MAKGKWSFHNVGVHRFRCHFPDNAAPRATGNRGDTDSSDLPLLANEMIKALLLQLTLEFRVCFNTKWDRRCHLLP